MKRPNKPDTLAQMGWIADRIGRIKAETGLIQDELEKVNSKLDELTELVKEQPLYINGVPLTKTLSELNHQIEERLKNCDKAQDNK